MGTLLDVVNESSLRTDRSDFGAGDTVRVHVRVVEGEKARTQVFEGRGASAAGRGDSRDLHGPQDRRGRGRRGANLSGALAPGGEGGTPPAGQGAPCQDYLPARTAGACRADRREDRQSQTVEEIAHGAIPKGFPRTEPASPEKAAVRASKAALYATQRGPFLRWGSV